MLYEVITFDGFGVDPLYCSSAGMAKQLGCPVILIVDGKAVSTSAAATVLGFKLFDVITSYSIHYTKLYESHHPFDDGDIGFRGVILEKTLNRGFRQHECIQITGCNAGDFAVPAGIDIVLCYFIRVHA